MILGPGTRWPQWRADGLTGEELSRQLSEIALAFTGLGATKSAALRHLYRALALSVVLTACLMVTLLVVPVI